MTTATSMSNNPSSVRNPAETSKDSLAVTAPPSEGSRRALRAEETSREALEGRRGEEEPLQPSTRALAVASSPSLRKR